MKIRYYFFLLALILVIPINNYFVKLLVYILLSVFSFRRYSPIHPIVWASLAWGFLFFNTFSGLIFIPTNVSKTAPIIYILASFLFFVFGFRSNNNLKPATIIIIGTNLISEKNAKHLRRFSYFSLIAFVLFAIDMFSFRGGSFTDLAILREKFQGGGVSIFGQLSSILMFGGLFSIISFFIGKKENILLSLVGLVSFLMIGLFSAGRQGVLQVMVVSLMLIWSIKYYKISSFIVEKHSKKLILVSVTVFVFYLAYVTIGRFQNNGSNLSKLEITEATTNIKYDEKIKEFFFTTGDVIETLFAEGTYYFSHQLILFSEWWSSENKQIVNFKIIQMSPFIERQFDRLFPFFETQSERYYRIMNNSWKTKESNFFGWRTANANQINLFGIVGSLFFIFLHGYFSKYFYNRFHFRPNLWSFSILTINNLMLFYTIMFSLFQDTYVMIFILISLYYFNTDRKMNRA